MSCDQLQIYSLQLHRWLCLLDSDINSRTLVKGNTWWHMGYCYKTFCHAIWQILFTIGKIGKPNPGKMKSLGKFTSFILTKLRTFGLSFLSKHFPFLNTSRNEKDVNLSLPAFFSSINLKLYRNENGKFGLIVNYHNC